MGAYLQRTGVKRAYLMTGDARLFYNLGLSHRKRFQLTGSHADLVEARLVDIVEAGPIARESFREARHGRSTV